MDHFTLTITGLAQGEVIYGLKENIKTRLTAVSTSLDNAALAISAARQQLTSLIGHKVDFPRYSIMHSPVYGLSEAIRCQPIRAYCD
ncbi:hypothetical protein GCM10011297_06310 [Bacterioplanes sanyensis]|nr:hypothetical protein GCM10011297_06310 [Bacterioplanes sanyensis]